jgi:hypothetical protein
MKMTPLKILLLLMRAGSAVIFLGIHLAILRKCETRWKASGLESRVGAGYVCTVKLGDHWFPEDNVTISIAPQQ